MAAIWNSNRIIKFNDPNFMGPSILDTHGIPDVTNFADTPIQSALESDVLISTDFLNCGKFTLEKERGIILDLKRSPSKVASAARLLF